MSSFFNTVSMKTLISAFVFSRVDYCNSLFANLPDKEITKLQRFQSNSARLTLRRKRRDHITPMLKELHWLPVRSRISYKVAVLCHKSIHGKAPLYIRDLIQLYVPSRSLRSENNCLLRIPTKRSKKYAGRSFSHFAPPLWNSLPLSLRLTSSGHDFRTGLKTYLMKRSFEM